MKGQRLNLVLAGSFGGLLVVASIGAITTLGIMGFVPIILIGGVVYYVTNGFKGARRFVFGK